jgi:hypothetical protein
LDTKNDDIETRIEVPQVILRELSHKNRCLLAWRASGSKVQLHSLANRIEKGIPVNGREW